MSSRALFVAGVLAIALNGCSPIENREDFATQLKNKTDAEVLKLAGKPAEIDRSNPDRVVWIYKSRTFDVGSRRTDPETDVIFAPAPDGKLHVADVQFK
jgi:hypothetical protein